MNRPARPSFDHIPTEEGREASRRLWDAAFGAPVEVDPAHEFRVAEALNKAFRNNTINVGATTNLRVPVRYRR